MAIDDEVERAHSDRLALVEDFDFPLAFVADAALSEFEGQGLFIDPLPAAAAECGVDLVGGGLDFGPQCGSVPPDSAAGAAAAFPSIERGGARSPPALKMTRVTVESLFLFDDLDLGGIGLGVGEVDDHSVGQGGGAHVCGALRSVRGRD